VDAGPKAATGGSKEVLGAPGEAVVALGSWVECQVSEVSERSGGSGSAIGHVSLLRVDCQISISGYTARIDGWLDEVSGVIADLDGGAKKRARAKRA
jgi:hypothetical protein